MADTYTTNLNLTKPEPGAAEDTWGISLNADLDSLDAIFGSGGTQINLNPNQINFADGKKLILGTGSDLEIYHDGSNSNIVDTGTGYLSLRGTDLRLQDSTGWNFVICTDLGQGGEVALLHSNIQKLKTTSTGIDVTGTITSDALTVSNGTNTTSIPTTSDRVAFTGASLNYVQSAGNLFIQPTGDLTLNGSGSEIMRLKDGKVGIGTTSPSKKLHVSTGDTNVAALFENTSSNGTVAEFLTSGDGRKLTVQPDHIFSNGILYFGSGSYTNIYRAATHTFQEDASNTEIMRITGNNVGIGTSSPSNPLTVVGADSMAIDDYIVHYGDSNTKIGFPSNDKFKIRVAGSDIATVTSTGLGIGTSSPSTALHVSAGDGSAELTVARTGTYASSWSLKPYNADFYIRESGSDRVAFKAGGNVGIGTTSPDALLEIDKGSEGEYLRVGGDNASNARSLRFTSSTASGSSVGALHTIKANSVGGEIAFANGNGNIMYLDVNRNVGIGTSSPARNLHVHASNFTDLHLTNDTTGATASDGTSFTAIGSDIYLTNREAGNMVFQTSGTERARITSDGNLAIGNISAAAKLDIRQDSGAAIRCEDGSGAYFVVKQGGLVGIGTPSPDAPLTVHNSSDPEIRFGYSSTQDHKIAWDSSKVFIHADPENANGSSAIGFAVDGSEKARIDSSGNLLVGTTNTFPPSDTGNEGVAVKPDNIAISRNASTPLFLDRMTSDGVLIDLRKDNNTGGIIGINEPQDNAEELYIANGTGTSSVGLAFWDYINTSRIAPCNGTGAYQDNSIDLGFSSARFDDIYATNGTIQTSDRNEKQDIQALTDAEQRVATACKGLIRRFRWQDAVEEKGDDARLHFGVIAQDLQDAFTAEGLDAGDYGMFISSTWTDDDGVEQTRLGVRYNELLAFIITTL